MQPFPHSELYPSEELYPNEPASVPRSRPAPALPHFAFPFRVAGGVVQCVEQDSSEEIRQCIAAVLKTRTGSRMENPQFGVPDELFELLPPNPSAESYIAAIEEWEPRARVVGEAEIEDLTKQVLIRNSENPGA